MVERRATALATVAYYGFVADLSVLVCASYIQHKKKIASVGIKLAQRLHGFHSRAACCLFVVCHSSPDQASRQTTRGRHSF